MKVTVRLMRNGVERTASVNMPMDGHGMRGNVNMSAPQAFAATLTNGRKAALSLMFNLNVAGGQRAAEPPRRAAEHEENDPPPWDAPPDPADHLAVLKQAAQRSDSPPTDAQISYLATLMRQRGERPQAVLDDQGRLSGKEAWAAIADRKGAGR